MIDGQEKWQVEVNGEIFETEFAELVSWIAENSLLEADMVRRGNLRWLEAGRVPVLREFFEAKANGTEAPYVAVKGARETVSNERIEANTEDNEAVSETRSAGFDVDLPAEEYQEGIPEPDTFTLDPQICRTHQLIPARYLCKDCSGSYCNDCPKSFGGSVRICPICGGMCCGIRENQRQIQRDHQYDSDINEGFGFNDFGNALVYPFKFKSSLILGGFLFAFFSLGKGAASMGGLFLVAAALICLMFANALTFGVLANTIDNFSQGFTGRNFMPAFEDFSLWDDVVHPFFLSIAVYISSFGIFIALVVGGAWYTWNSFTGSLAGAVQQRAGADLDRKSNQSVDHVRGLMEKYRKQNTGRQDVVLGPDGLTEGQRNSIDEEAELMSINDLANNYRKSQLESTIGKTGETKEREMRAMATKFFQVAGVFILLIGAAFLWGMFYFPAACAVAGYTRSFRSTLNPLLGLDTIKYLGVDYAKILLMFVLLSLLSVLISGFVAVVLSPFNLPRMGNPLATVIGSFVTFYLSITFAVTLGYALFKNSRKLNLYRS